MMPIHKVFTIGFAENGLVLIQHSLDDEDLSQTRVEPTCENLMETLGYRLRAAYELYHEWCEFYELNAPNEGNGFSDKHTMPSCMKNLTVTKDIEKSKQQLDKAKELGKADGPEQVIKTEGVKPGSRLYIKKKKQ